jgi:hypothetical protein
MAAKLSDDDHRESGLSHLDYFRELIQRDGDNAIANLHADHLRSLLSLLPIPASKTIH